MVRIVAIAATMPFAAAADAQGYHGAMPSVVPARVAVIGGGMSWRYDGGRCTAGRGSSRDAIVCEQILGRVGAPANSGPDGAAFDAPAPAGCDARAK